MVDQQPARLRGRDAAAIAHQQVLARLHLSRRTCRLRADWAMPRAAAAWVKHCPFGDPHKVLELLQIHRQMRYLVDQSATSCIAGIATRIPQNT